MDKEIGAKYQVFLSDLFKLNIGDYLKGRQCKIFLTKINAINLWKTLYQEAEDERKYYSIGMDTEKVDNEEGFKKLFTYVEKQVEVERLITQIVENFINHRIVYTDFSDLVESVEIIDFNDINVKVIKDAIIDFNAKKILQQDLIKGVSQSNVALVKEKHSEKTNIFIVHGHNEEIKQIVARILEKQNLNPIILNEQTDEGLTIIEKLEKYSDVHFAVVILTSDDLGKQKLIKNLNPRARQNVILELGYFFAKLGRKNVLALYEKNVELPSDFSGILYTPIDSDGHWKYKLGKEIMAAGFKFDLNKI